MAGRLASRTDVARLYGRAAFGATAADLDAWAGKPYAEVVEQLLEAKPSDIDPNELRRLYPSYVWRFGNERDGFEIGQLRQAQSWWLERMKSSAAPLHERMTLLWHGHFATARRNPYPDASMLVTQNQTLRTHALGSFRDMALAMNLDPAMLWWLDGTLSSRPAANENYARELFELFTLGKYPQIYTESDIREAARALTGWRADGFTQGVAFDPARHDAGVKNVLGHAIKNLADKEHEAVVSAALAQPVSNRFIAYKVVRELAYDPAREDLLRKPDRLVRRVADVLHATGWSIKAAVREVLLSEEFRDPSRQRVRQPVEMLVHATKALGIGADDETFHQSLAGMGQRLFDHTNVGGWPFGATWFSPPATLARYAMAVRTWELSVGNPFRVWPGSADLKAWSALLGLSSITANTERTVRAYLATKATAAEGERVAGVLVLLLCSPDWAVI